MWGGDFDRMIVNFIIAVALISAAIGVALAYGIPWLWSVLKPLIHGWTA